MPLDILRITDPGCPFAYSAEPPLTVIRNRYGSQINWSLAMIGLAEDGSKYDKMGYGSVAMAQSYAKFSRNYGMPVTSEARKRPLATYPACKVVIASRIVTPGSQEAVQRALQIAWFTTAADLEQDDCLIEAISEVSGIDAAAIVALASSSDEVDEIFTAERATARSAKGSPTQAQGKHAMDGDVARYTAPSLLMHDSSGRPLEAGGFQPLEAYDVIIANADPTLVRNKPESVMDLLSASQWPLCTAELALALAAPFTPRDDAAVEAELIALAAEGSVTRKPVGNGILWSAA